RHALCVGHDRVDLDVVDLHTETHGRLIGLRRRRFGRWLLLRGQQATAESGESQSKRNSLRHRCNAGLATPILAGIAFRDSGFGIRDSGFEWHRTAFSAASASKGRTAIGNPVSNPEPRIPSLGHRITIWRWMWR